ncbi:MAG: hypothetical protein Kow0056_03960 [Coriobacteriia bacterium]
MGGTWGILLVSAAVFALADRGLKGILLLSVAIASGLAIGAAHAGRIGARCESLDGSVAEFACSAKEDSRDGRWGTSVVAEARSVDGSFPGTVEALVFLGDTRLSLGEQFIAVGRLDVRHEEQADGLNVLRGPPVVLDAVRVRDAHWPDGLLGAVYGWRASTSAALRSRGDPGCLLAALLLGDRRGVRGTDVEHEFRVAGLAHMLAVSGLHLGIVALGCGALVRAAGGGPRWQLVAVIATGSVFGVMTGWQPSTLRALAMVVAAGAGRVVGRRSDGLGAVSAAVVAGLAKDPSMVADVGFQLSVCAVGALVALLGPAHAVVHAALHGRWKRASQAACATVVAQWGTMPVSAGAFHLFSVVAPLANLVALPVLAPAMASGLTGLALGVSTAPGEAFLSVACALIALVSSVARWCAHLPYASIPLPAFGPLLLGTWLGVGMLLWFSGEALTSRRKARVALALASAAVALAVAWPFPVGPRVVVGDVGQGDAILVRDGADALLVDCGPSGGALLDFLGRQGVRRLDAVVLTHPHEDHIGGALDMRGVVMVDTVLHPAAGPQGEFGELAAGWRSWGATFREICSEDQRRLGSVSVRALWPPRGVAVGKTNDASVVLVVEGDQARVVLGADAEEEVWERLEAEGALVAADAIKIPHHGSCNGITSAALTAMGARFAAISVGANDFGHPSPRLLAMLRDQGVRIFRTDEDGDVVFRLE